MRAVITIATLAILQASASAEPTAEQLYDEGQGAFDRGDYPTAIARWESGYQLSQLPLFIYNVAQAYLLSGDCTHALTNFRRYVALDPGSEQRGRADGFIAELQPKCGGAAATPPRVESSPALPPRVDEPVRPPPTSGRGVKIAGLATGGVGVALVTTGLLFGRRASALGDEVTRDCAVACDWTIEKHKERDGKRYATIGKVLDGVGLAAVAVGVGMYIYGARKDQAVVAIQPDAHGATVMWSGAW